MGFCCFYLIVAVYLTEMAAEKSGLKSWWVFFVLVCLGFFFARDPHVAVVLGERKDS